MTTQHGSDTTWQQHKTWYDHYWAQTTEKGKKMETTIHQAKQPQVSVRVSMIETLNEEIKLSSLSVFLQLVPVTSCTGCCMWRMRAAVGTVSQIEGKVL
jgi:hypothetical protein